MNKYVWIMMGLVIIYVLFRLISRFNRHGRAYQREIHEILTKDKYRVKGRHE